MTRKEALELARNAKSITRYEHDGGLLEKTVTYDEMHDELDNYSRWFVNTKQGKVFINVIAGLWFEVNQ